MTLAMNTLLTHTFRKHVCFWLYL